MIDAFQSDRPVVDRSERGSRFSQFATVCISPLRQSIPFAVALISMLVIACDKSAPPRAAAVEKIRVVATVYPLADIVKQVGGDLIDCTWIAEQGQALDAADPTPETRARIRQAGMVITNGFGEDFAGAGFDDPLTARGVLRRDVLDAAQKHVGCRQLWLDPDVAKELANAIAERLILKRPLKATELRQSAQRFSKSLDETLGKFAPQLRSIKGRKVLVLSTDYSALTRRLELIEVHPLTASPIRLSDEDFATLRVAIRAESPTAILTEVGLPAAVEQDLAARLGLPVVAMDSLGTSAGTGRNTYQAILEYDLNQLGRVSSGPASVR